MTKKFRRIRKRLRRRDYESALARYHAARRRGDSSDAHHWLKVADMHLRVDDRFKAGVHASLMREIEYQNVRRRTDQSMNDASPANAAVNALATQEAIERFLDEVDRRSSAEWEAMEGRR